MVAIATTLTDAETVNENVSLLESSWLGKPPCKQKFANRRISHSTVLCIDFINEARLGTIASFFLDIFRVSS